jgi:sterol 3beta-glucosyltransferase
MKIGIFTYGTRGDVQPYIALALGMMEKGHDILLAAPSNFKNFIESYGIRFHPLFGDAEAMMNSKEGQKVLSAENTIELMKYFFSVLHEIRQPLRQSYWEGISQVDYIIANSATLPIVSAIAEKQQKKIALTYFMPPVVPTKEFPLSDFDYFDFSFYNKLTYSIAQNLYWKFVKADTNEYRSELNLIPLSQNLIHYINADRPLDLYCISPSLIPQPKDWDTNHKITGFLTLPTAIASNELIPASVELQKWLKEGTKPIYIGFGSNGIGNPQKIIDIIKEILSQTNERILFCTGWANFDEIPSNPKLFVSKYMNHDTIFPQCKIGIFHGGAGTLATILRHQLAPIIVSFYTDQPTWGKIIERKKIGIHIPYKKLNAKRLIDGINMIQQAEFVTNLKTMSQLITSENGNERAINEIEKYFLQNKL